MELIKYLRVNYPGIINERYEVDESKELTDIILDIASSLVFITGSSAGLVSSNLYVLTVLSTLYKVSLASAFPILFIQKFYPFAIFRMK